MGCGSSTHGGAIRVRIDSALASHLSAALAIDPESLEIKQYVSLLRSDGCDTAADFDDMTIDDLKGEPFCFKRQHLKKIARSRGKAEPRRSSEAERLPNITPVQTADYETASAGSKATRSRKPAVPVTAASLPAGPRTKSLLPTGKHAFLSYQWDVQEQVKEIKGMLNERQIKCKDAMFFFVFLVVNLEDGMDPTSVLSLVKPQFAVNTATIPCMLTCTLSMMSRKQRLDGYRRWNEV